MLYEFAVIGKLLLDYIFYYSLEAGSIDNPHLACLLGWPTARRSGSIVQQSQFSESITLGQRASNLIVDHNLDASILDDEERTRWWTLLE